MYTTTVGPLFSRSVTRPRGHRAKKAMVYTIFLGKQGKRVYTIGPERRVCTIEPQTRKKEKSLHSGGIYFFLAWVGVTGKFLTYGRRSLHPDKESIVCPQRSARPMVPSAKEKKGNTPPPPPPPKKNKGRAEWSRQDCCKPMPQLCAIPRHATLRAQRLKNIEDLKTRTIPTKDLPHRVVVFGGWCANCRNLRKRQNMHHPQFALAMPSVDFVELVRGFRGLKISRS